MEHKFLPFGAPNHPSVKQVDLKNLRPYGDAMNDGRMQVNFTLPINPSPDAEEAAVKRAMVATARRVVVLADSTKFGVEFLRSFATTNEIDVIITDTGVAAPEQQRLTNLGIEVICA